MFHRCIRPQVGPEGFLFISKDQFRDRVETVNAGMLPVANGGRWVPMSYHANGPTQALWFLTAAGTQIFVAVSVGSELADYVLADAANGLFARLTGTLSLSTDRARRTELWSPAASAWSGKGIDDPALRLLCLHLSGREVWVTPMSGTAFFFGIAKARLTGENPDMGDQFPL